MSPLWICPRCGRIFRRPNLQHACGVGSRKGMLAGKPEPLVRLYLAMERTLKALGGVEIVAKRRYTLFRIHAFSLTWFSCEMRSGWPFY